MKPKRYKVLLTTAYDTHKYTVDEIRRQGKAICHKDIDTHWLAVKAVSLKHGYLSQNQAYVVQDGKNRIYDYRIKVAIKFKNSVVEL